MKRKTALVLSFACALAASASVFTLGGCQADCVDFIVTVKDRDAVVLHISDPQIIEESDENKELKCYRYIRETVQATNPDLILVTGDLVYGRYDHTGEAFTELVAFMESLETPWAPVFGNHDNESMMGVAWQCQQLENAENCLFKRNSLETGNGNYTVGICGKDGKLQRVFFMMDSNGCGAASVTSMEDGQIRTSNGFGKKQLKWLEDEVEKVQSKAKKAKLSLAFHIQTWEFENAFQRYGYLHGTTQSAPINIDLHPNKQQGDFGYVGRDLKGAWREDRLAALLSKDVIDSVFVGHEHCNNASVVFEGVRYQYGQKCSEYDRKNYLCKDGTIVGSYSEQLPPLMGGTVFSISKDSGEIVNPHVYLCDTWSNFVWGE